MKTIQFRPASLLLPLILTLALAASCAAQGDQARLAILPLTSNGVDTVTLATTESILRTEIAKLSSMDVVSGRRTREALGGEGCAEIECAAAVGRTLRATRVLGCQLSALGEKIIVQYFLVDPATGKQLLVDQATAASTGDLEVLMKRVAKSVVDLEPVGKTAEVGQILESESVEPARREARKHFGFAFGYLYPQSGYNNEDKKFVLDTRFDYEINDYAFGMLVGIRNGFAMGLYSSYLTSRTDLCPYVGGGLGFHWVDHTSRYDPVTGQDISGRGDGFELSLNGGIRVLHTYSFQMIFNLEYIATLNDYDDRAIVFTLGIL